MLERRMVGARSKLLAARARREAPFRDEKVIVSWNALAIRAFAEAGAAFAREDYVDLARESAEFVWSAVRTDDRLLHVYMEGRSKIGGFLDDHAALGNALLSLHGATLEVRWLEAARWLCEEVLSRFWDEAEGTVFDTAADSERLVMRPRDTMDNATPSGNGLLLQVFAMLFHLTGNAEYRERGEALIAAFSGELERNALAMPVLMTGQFLLEDAVQVVITGAEADALARAAWRAPQPNLVLQRIADTAALPAGHPAKGKTANGAAAYVCRGPVCSLPIGDPKALAAEIAR